MTDEKQGRATPPADGLAEFTEYFVKNYPGKTAGRGHDTIISDPYWHAPKIFRAAQSAIERALATRAAPPLDERDSSVDLTERSVSETPEAGALRAAQPANEFQGP